MFAAAAAAAKSLQFSSVQFSRSVVSNSVRPHRRQPNRLPRPWDSPGKNTGVGCHFPLQWMKVKSESEVAQLCLTLGDPMDCSLSGSSTHGISQKEYWSGVPLPSRNKSYLWQNRTQYTTQWWNTESLTKIWNKTRMLILTTSIQHSIGSLSHSNHTWKNKRYSNEGEDLTLSLYADMVLYIENPMDSTQKLLVEIQKLS